MKRSDVVLSHVDVLSQFIRTSATERLTAAAAVDSALLPPAHVAADRNWLQRSPGHCVTAATRHNATQSTGRHGVLSAL